MIFPLYLPGGVTISSINRILAPINSCFDYNPDAPLPIDIFPGTYNIFRVTGEFLNNIVAVQWLPSLQAHVEFRMLPWHICDIGAFEATFGIAIHKNSSNISLHGGCMTFSDYSNNSVSVPTATFSSI